jgi:hypothetical protein
VTLTLRMRRSGNTILMWNAVLSKKPEVFTDILKYSKISLDVVESVNKDDELAHTRLFID